MMLLNILSCRNTNVLEKMNLTTTTKKYCNVKSYYGHKSTPAHTTFQFKTQEKTNCFASIRMKWECRNCLRYNLKLKAPIFSPKAHYTFQQLVFADHVIIGIFLTSEWTKVMNLLCIKLKVGIMNITTRPQNTWSSFAAKIDMHSKIQSPFDSTRLESWVGLFTINMLFFFTYKTKRA